MIARLIQGAEAIVDTMTENATPADLEEAVQRDVCQAERCGDGGILREDLIREHK